VLASKYKQRAKPKLKGHEEISPHEIHVLLIRQVVLALLSGKMASVAT
jgi:hypothetical protein